MIGALWLVVALAPAPAPTSPAGPALRFACNPTAPLLRLAVGSASLSLGPEGIRLGGVAPASSDEPLAKARAAVVLDATDGLTAQGKDLKRCDPAGRCSRVQSLPYEMNAAVPSGAGMLLAIGGTSPGLYRAELGRLGAPSLVVGGEVLSLCPASDQLAWAVLARDGAWLIARVDATSVQLLPATELVAAALLETPSLGPDDVRRAVDVLVADGYRRPAEAARLEAEPVRELRAQAPRLWLLDPDARGTARLWLLGHDADPEVRQGALEAVSERCPALPEPTCVALLTVFIDDASLEVSWTARDALLWRRPERALAGAPSNYKLDAISQLAARMQRLGEPAVREALQLLVADEDPAVRRAARVVAGQFEQ